MTVTLPDHPATLRMSEEDIRLEFTCGLFARGEVSSRVAAEMAGVSYDAFLGALQERGISRYSLEMLREDIETLNHLWPDSALPVPAS